MKRLWKGKARLAAAIAIIFVCCVLLAAFLVLRQKKFGRLPTGARDARIRESRHFVDGEFRNLVPATPDEDAGSLENLTSWLFDDTADVVPAGPVATLKTDLRGLDPDTDCIVWFGHSSFYLQLDGIRILVDPVLSDHASPFSFMVRAFPGTSVYTADDIPDVDYLVYSHDHWDHLDHPTALALRGRAKKVLCGLGVGEHLEYWGYDSRQIIEGDWYETVNPATDFSVFIAPARHFSGRGILQNRSLWVGFVFKTRDRTVFYSGDSGYGPHFAEIGRLFGAMDLAILDCGQYDRNWQSKHMNPEQAVRAAQDLRAGTLFPVHSGKFAIARHPWREPFEQVAAHAVAAGVPAIIPTIGQVIVLDPPTESVP